MHYLYNWYYPHTCLTEKTICRWHFVRLFKSGYNAVEKCYRSWFEWNGHIVMIFSNRSNPEHLDFSFNGKSVLITTSHKHIGVAFNDAKWNTHVDNIQSSLYKHLNILRRLKYRLSRTNKLYLVYIRPHFEYACELWDNCGIGNSQILEQLQLEAARIVSCLHIFTKTEIVYIETGWELLSVRRREGNFKFFIIELIKIHLIIL